MRRLNGFLLGCVTACILLLLSGLGIAVFNAGGGQISGVGAPAANDDLATVDYLNARKTPTCYSQQQINSTTLAGQLYTVCTSCSGILTIYIVRDGYTDGQSSITPILDGVNGDTLSSNTSSVWGYDRVAYVYARFTSSLAFNLTDGGLGSTEGEVDYCLDA